MTKQPWECPNCRRICAPHMDHCDCRPFVTAPPHYPLPIQQPFQTTPYPGTPGDYPHLRPTITCGQLASVTAGVWTQ